MLFRVPFGEGCWSGVGFDALFAFLSVVTTARCRLLTRVLPSNRKRRSLSLFPYHHAKENRHDEWQQTSGDEGNVDQRPRTRSGPEAVGPEVRDRQNVADSDRAFATNHRSRSFGRRGETARLPSPISILSRIRQVKSVSTSSTHLVKLHGANVDIRPSTGSVKNECENRLTKWVFVAYSVPNADSFAFRFRGLVCFG